MHPFVNTAVKAAREAGKVIARSMERLDLVQVSEKSRNDFVTNIDHSSESIIIEIIQKMYPDHAILGEETGLHPGQKFQWIIDPLDGTKNFIHGLPHVAISIGIKSDTELLHGVIYNPFKDELFTATKGSGAFLNNHRLRVSQITNIPQALMGTNFHMRDRDDFIKNMPRMMNLASQCSGLRSSGSAALDLAYVAAGRLDLYCDKNLKSWDIAAGIVLLTEAGGFVTNQQGKEMGLDEGSLLASNAKIHKDVLAIINPKA